MGIFVLITDHKIYQIGSSEEILLLHSGRCCTQLLSYSVSLKLKHTVWKYGQKRLLKAERLRFGLDGKIAATHISLIITFNDVFLHSIHYVFYHTGVLII